MMATALYHNGFMWRKFYSMKIASMPFASTEGWLLSSPIRGPPAHDCGGQTDTPHACIFINHLSSTKKMLSTSPDAAASQVSHP